MTCIRLALIGLFALLAVGCSIFGSSAKPEFYVLYPEEGRAIDGPSLQVELRRPTLPDYLERPEIVRRVEHGRLALSERERWGASLTKMVASTLVTDLARRLPRCEIYAESGSISSTPDLQIELDVHQFERSSDGNVVLSAQAGLHWYSGAQRVVIERFEQERAPESSSTEATVAAMSALLGELAEAIAQRIAAGSPSGPEPAESAPSGGGS